MANDVVKFVGNPLSIISSSVSPIINLVSELEREREKTTRIEIEADFYKHKETEITKRICKNLEMNNEREERQHKEVMEKLSIERREKELAYEVRMKECKLKEDKLNMIAENLDKTDLTNSENFSVLLKSIVEL